MRFVLVLGLLVLTTQVWALDVNLVTHSGARTLRTWSNEELKKFAAKNGEISAQKMLIDESTKNLELNDRADVDLITLYGANGKMARIPRFMIWKGAIKFRFKDGELSSKGESSRLLVPAQIFSLEKISKIELSRSAIVYPGSHLTLRTNPAASRGEKLYTQSCLACHSLPSFPKLPISALAGISTDRFSKNHHTWSLTLDSKAIRGLNAYSDSFATAKTEVK